MEPDDVVQKAKEWRLFDNLLCDKRSCMGRMGPEDFARHSDTVEARCPECGRIKAFSIEQLRGSLDNLEEWFS